MRAASGSWRARAPLGAIVGVLGSLLVHLLVFAGLRWAGTMPEMDFELELPSQVEFGVSDAPEVEEPLAAPTEPAPAPQPVTAAPAESPERERRKPDPPAADAGTADAGTPAEPARPSDAGVPAAGKRPLLAAFAPEGAQIALRVHLGRVRGSELAPDVRALLEAIADWRLILDGSGLDPLHDLERIYIASPDLRRAHLVIAGQYVGGVEVAQRAVAAMAAARGREATWRLGGIRVAPWHNLDETERILALIAPHQFAITRTEDLRRVLQVARALARRKAGAATPEADPGEALLALDDGETLALAVEGARLFARGNLRGIPERLEASVRSRPGELDARATGHFESDETAELAAAYWQRVRDRYAGNPLVALLGLREPLADAEISAEGAVVTARTRVTLQQARLVLGFIRDALAPPAPAPAPPVAVPPTVNDPTPTPPAAIPGGLRRSEPTAPSTSVKEPSRPSP